MAKGRGNHLKNALNSVLAGYSVIPFEADKIFIKHFGVMDSVETEFQYDTMYELAREKGVNTEEEKLAFLAENELWTTAEEDKLKKLSSETEFLRKRKANSYIPSQSEDIEKQIKENEKGLSKLLSNKIRLLGTTAESLAAKRSEDFYIYHSLFKDNKLSVKLFDEDFEEVDAEFLEGAKLSYYHGLSPILHKNIKKIALSREFMDLMNLAQDPYQILGKPYCQYTYFQIDLISFGRFYKHILSQETKPPANLLEDPDKLEQWFEMSQNAQKIMQKTGKEGVGDSASVMFGATTDDLNKVLGNDPNIKNLDTEIKKAAGEKGGMLNKEDMMKLHGFKV
jgi:hypothetical protein